VGIRISGFDFFESEDLKTNFKKAFC
jgi:hypothetical protein